MCVFLYFGASRNEPFLTEEVPQMGSSEIERLSKQLEREFFRIKGFMICC